MRFSASLAYLAGATVAVGAAVAALVLVGLPGSDTAGSNVAGPDRVERGPAAVHAALPAASVSPPLALPCGADGHTAMGDACKADVAPGEKGDVLASGAPQLLEFEAAYCSACATMAPVVKAVVSSCAKAASAVQHVDVGDDNGEAIARRYAVASLPTFIAVDADGHEVFRRVGVQAPKEIASILAEVTGEHCVAD